MHERQVSANLGGKRWNVSLNDYILWSIAAWNSENKSLLSWSPPFSSWSYIINFILLLLFLFFYLTPLSIETASTYGALQWLRLQNEQLRTTRTTDCKSSHTVTYTAVEAHIRTLHFPKQALKSMTQCIYLYVYIFVFMYLCMHVIVCLYTDLFIHPNGGSLDWNSHSGKWNVSTNCHPQPTFHTDKINHNHNHYQKFAIKYSYRLTDRTIKICSAWASANKK